MRRWLLVVVFVLAAWPTFAQQQGDVVLITSARKQMQGAQSFSTVVPLRENDVPLGTESLVLLADLTDADKRDPSKSFALRVFHSTDGGQTWKFAGGVTFQGAPDVPSGFPVGVSLFPARNFLNSMLRFELDVPVRMSLGATATITTAPPF